MHRIMCPKRNNLYADCQCVTIYMNDHTYELRRYNDNAVTIERANELEMENAELKRRIQELENRK